MGSTTFELLIITKTFLSKATVIRNTAKVE